MRPIRLLTVIVSVSFVLVAGRAALAQCEGFAPGVLGPGASDAVHSLTPIDPDGASGPIQPQLVATGVFRTIGGHAAAGVALFDGVAWRSFGSGIDVQQSGANVNASAWYDPDESGPLPGHLYVGGSFLRDLSVPSVTLQKMARWDGAAWQQVGGGMGNTAAILNMAVFDVDGGGPNPPELFVCGSFTSAGGQGATGFAAWNGATWRTIPVTGSQVIGMTVLDPDGDGPQALSLLISGTFTRIAGVNATNIASFDGTTWRSFGAGLNDHARAFIRADPDGAGPAPVSLVVGGIFTASGATTMRGVAWWDQTQWRPIGSMLGGSFVRRLALHDLDGIGPQPERLIATGEVIFTAGQVLSAVSWDGAAWTSITGGMNMGPGMALARYDEDGEGGAPARLIAGGPAWPTGRLGEWRNGAWRPFGDGFTTNLSAVALFDSDGDGPLAARPTVVGTLANAGAATLSWDGASWVSIGAVPPTLTVQALHAHDFDADGPQPPRLVAAGRSTSATFPDRCVYVLEETGWQPMPDIVSGRISAMCSHDFDGDGPISKQLVVGGTTADNRSLVWSWNGTAWDTSNPTNFGDVYVLHSYDPDQAGPAPPMLVAAGGLSAIYGYNGGSWAQMGTGFWSVVYSLTEWDPDGDGPGFPSLIAGGGFGSAGVPSRVARWDGSAWQSLGAGQTETMGVVINDDPDGTGPAPARLLAGLRRLTGSVNSTPLTTWDGAAWTTLPDQIDGLVDSGVPFDPDGSGPAAPQIMFVGNFGNAGGFASAHAARYSRPGEPMFTQQPQPVAARLGGVASFTVNAVGGDLVHRWRRDGQPVLDGPTLHGSVVSGAASASLSISQLGDSDAGAYDCTITNICGTETSMAATLAVLCPADFDDGSGTGTPDGGVTIDDLLYYLVLFDAGTVAADLDDGSGTGTPDGGVTIDDLLYYLVRFDAGC